MLSHETMRFCVKWHDLILKMFFQDLHSVPIPKFHNKTHIKSRVTPAFYALSGQYFLCELRNFSMNAFICSSSSESSNLRSFFIDESIFFASL